jgi:hypothetical protein
MHCPTPLAAGLGSGGAIAGGDRHRGDGGDTARRLVPRPRLFPAELEQWVRALPRRCRRPRRWQGAASPGIA